jgi:competence protein ComEA
MNLRLPVVAAVVALAAGAAVMRSLHSGPPVPTLSTATAPGLPGAALETGGVKRAVPPSMHPATIVVYVAGEVAHTGIYTVPATARGADALRAAGGPLADADLVAVNLAARVSDGDEVAVPARGAPSRGIARTRSKSTPSAQSRGKHKRKRRHARSPAASDTAGDAASDVSTGDAPTELVDLNAADIDVLQTLPGIGPALAERIVAVRDQSGPFVSTDDLLDVGGMTQGKVDAIAPYVTLR